MNLRRASAFTVVLVIHLALVVFMSRQYRREPSSAEPQDFVGTWIALTLDPTPRASGNLTPRQTVLPPFIPVQIEVPEVAPITVPDASTAIDWMTEAHTSAVAVSVPSKVRSLGQLPEVGSSEKPPPAQIVHHAGESYRDSDGNHVAWVNDNCYVVSELPPLGTPDVLARMIPTHTVCRDQSAPEGELFRDLDAYKKRHPQ